MKTKPLLIVNPTKFLGNLLIALGPIQAAVRQFQREGQPYRVVLDEKFEPLVHGLFDADSVIFYPRAELKQASSAQRIKIYCNFISQLRRLKAVAAIDMEGDSVSSVLTVTSGAKSTVGPCSAPRSAWYNRLSDPKKEPEQSEFYRYRNLLRTVIGLEMDSPVYGKLAQPSATKMMPFLVKESIIQPQKNLVVLHTGASKERKFWPLRHWVALIEMLFDSGATPVLIGRGKIEKATNLSIAKYLSRPIADFTDTLSLTELAELIGKSRFFIGNDSGPMHLACALGIEGIGIFGPTYESLWGPLLPNVSVMRGETCPSSCRNGHNCKTSFSCLTSLLPETVFQNFASRCDWVANTQCGIISKTIGSQSILADGQKDSDRSIDLPERHSVAQSTLG